MERYLTRIKITEIEVEKARACAKKRLKDAEEVRAKDGFGVPSEESHFWGAMGEIALSKHLDMAWYCKSKVWNEPDVGRYEVRAASPGKIYVKTKKNDRNHTPIACILFKTPTVATLAGWILAGKLREIGTLQDPGNRGKPAHFLWNEELDVLNPIFPEAPLHALSSPNETAWSVTPGDVGRDFPLRKDADGKVSITWLICEECGGGYSILADHLRKQVHMDWLNKSQTVEGRVAMPIQPTQETYRFTKLPEHIDFGMATVCPRCRGKKSKAFCRRCNDFGIVPNVGPVA